MATDTFYRLPEEKRNKILLAIRHEFSRASYEDVSINRIIHEADIPRGSFYQYFTDKQDVFGYLIHGCMEFVIERSAQMLTETEGDPFAFSLRIFESVTRMIHEHPEDRNFYFNMFGSLRMQDHEFLEGLRKAGYCSYQRLKSQVNGKKLRIQTQQELDDVLDILYSILMTAMCELFSRTETDTEEQVRSRLSRKLEIVKKGILISEEEA